MQRGGRPGRGAPAAFVFGVCRAIVIAMKRAALLLALLTVACSGGVAVRHTEG